MRTQNIIIEAVKADCTVCGRHTDYDHGSNCVECNQFYCEDCGYDDSCNDCIVYGRDIDNEQDDHLFLED